MGFNIKTKEEIEIMAEAGRRLGEILAKLGEEVRLGTRTDALDRKSFQLIREAGCEPAFLNYRPVGAKRPYPATLCVSINDVVVHGVPSKRVIEDGDIVSLDLGLKYKGLYVDAALTVGVGDIDSKNEDTAPQAVRYRNSSVANPPSLPTPPKQLQLRRPEKLRKGSPHSVFSPQAARYWAEEKKKLIVAARNALEAGIKQAVPGKTLGDIGFTIEKFVKAERFSIVEGLTGHGIGRELHEEPVVQNFGKPGKGERLKAGMVIAIEPMISMGGGKIKQLEDESFATADGSLSAHFEHTVAITENGPRVLTRV